MLLEMPDPGGCQTGASAPFYGILRFFRLQRDSRCRRVNIQGIVFPGKDRYCRRIQNASRAHRQPLAVHPGSALCPFRICAAWRFCTLCRIWVVV